MNLKKLSFSDQFAYLGSSPRRKVVVSGFGLGLAASFVICVLLLNFSFKSPFFVPGFSGFTYSDNNNSIISWPFSFSSTTSASSSSSSSTSSSSNDASTTSVSFSSKGSEHSLVVSGTIEGNLSQNGSFSIQESGDFKKTHKLNVSQIDGSLTFSNFTTKETVLEGKGEVLRNTHVENFTKNVKNESFIDQESEITKIPPELDTSRIDVNMTFSNFTGNGTVSDVFSSNKTGESYNASPTYSDGVDGSSVEEKEGTVIEDKGDLSVEQNGAIVQSNGKSLTGNRKDFYGDCDIFDGEWVSDDTKPYYPPGSCPHIDRDFDCHLNKRPDGGYVKWRWQPYACDIPSLNATDFLERLRGKSLVFVGDSLNRNMWESLVCILRHSIRDKKRVYEISGRHEFKKKGFYAFRFEDYNCSVDFVGSPFLVKESTFNGKNGSFETLRLDLMDQTTSMYSDSDILIFNTGHWWTHEKTSRGEDYYQEGNHVHSRLKVLEAYKRALSTWARWVDKNIDGSRTQVIFRGYSVTHFRGGPWNSGGQCHKETEPIFNKTYLAKYPSKMKILQHVLHNMTTSVMYMNISRLTDYRKDGHPSIYRKEYKTLEEQMAGVHSQDCSHWCLPGVPDTWNELLYASLLKSRKGSWERKLNLD